MYSLLRVHRLIIPRMGSVTVLPYCARARHSATHAGMPRHRGQDTQAAQPMDNHGGNRPGIRLALVACNW